MTHKGWHCAYDTHYHIVFPVKYRKALLAPDIAQEIKSISKRLEERYDLEIEQVGTDGDHIHLLVSFHPKYAIGDFVRLYKSITAKQVFLKFPHIKKDLWGGEFWTDGYYAATVSEKGNWNVVERYVKNQGKHDVANLTLW
jgi:putative transposase